MKCIQFAVRFCEKPTFVIMSVMKHVTLKLSVDWSTDEPLYTSQLDIAVASKLDTKGLHLDNDDTPSEIMEQIITHLSTLLVMFPFVLLMHSLKFTFC